MDAVCTYQHITVVHAGVAELQLQAIGLCGHLFGTPSKVHTLQREGLGQRGQQVGAVDGQLRRIFSNW
jgi:hypothetical protein